MTTDLKDKQEEKKEIKKRKSFIPPELSAYHEKRKKEPHQPLVKSSIGFPSEEHRLMVTKTYKELGFTTMKSFFMTLVELVNEDEDLKNKLKKKSIELKKR